MSNYNWCHGPKCHENHTQDRIRGVKVNKVLRTRKVAITNWNRDSAWQWFCSTGCWNQFFNKYADQCRQIAPRNEPKETPIEVQVETHTDWRGQPYKQKVIKEIDNTSANSVG
jgi:hypothetical protein